MRILLVHNHYQNPGGEDQVFLAEAELLRSHGHAVSSWTVHNDRVSSLGALALSAKTLWNQDVYRELRALCRALRPDVVHFHNTFPLASPSAYYAARHEGATVVQTLHNYRLLCPATTFFRDGKVCEDCLGRAVPWPGVLNRCYRGSRTASAGAALWVAAHRAARTWTRAIDLYIAPTEFLRRKFVEGGVPAAKIVCKPHFLPVDPGAGDHRGAFALFVGRLVREKGVEQLRDAWSRPGRRPSLKVIGRGPLGPLLEGSAPGLECLGHKSHEEVLRLMKDAGFLVFPSEWYEAFGLTIIEAFATGLPVIASELGTAADLVEHGRTGLHYRPGDASDLAAKVEWAVEHPTEMAAMGKRARTEYLTRYTAGPNHGMLMDIYRRASFANGGPRSRRASRVTEHPATP